MTFNVTNSVNSALVSGAFGLQQASNGITRSSIDIANKATQSRDTTEVLSDAASQQLGNTGRLIAGTGNQDSLTSDILSLQNQLNYAQASSKVIGVAKDVIGNLIDDIA